MPAKKILLVANTAWNLWNYRFALIKTLEQSGYTVVLVAPNDRFACQLESLARFIPLWRLSRKSFSLVQNFRLLLELYRIFRRERPELALLYTVKPNILGNIAAAFAGCRTISVVEGLGYSGSTAARWRWLAAPLFRIALRPARRVVFLNRDDRREFLDRRLVSEKQAVIIHGPGIDPDTFSPQPKPVNDRTMFLFSGRFLSEKGIREFAAAARELQRENQAAEFQVLGAPDAGNPGTLSQDEIDRWQQEGFLKYLGQADDVRPFLAQADVLVLPSFYREGVPRSVLEAMAMEKIIITTDTPGCRDTVEDGLNGYLVPPRDVRALADAMRRILDLSPEQRVAMGARSRQKVRAEFSDAMVLPQYVTLIAAVADSK